MTEDHFIDKTTSVKTVERIKLKLVHFAKESKVEFQVAFNPDDSSQVDQLLNMDPKKNVIIMAIEGFKQISTEHCGAKFVDE